ncbi:MAG: hypothetical protein CSA62_13575 [Planctomycetota bacterium]|nr:MAG: hypothetical protein CSA62_13575 [Planctomycetota bacterium]
MKGPGHKAVFLDRDGVLNVEQGFITSADQLKPVPGLVSALRRLGQAGFLRIVVTNQSALARGLINFHELCRIHQKLRALCEEELDAILACPHHPEAGNSALTRSCPCRKPNGGMLRHAGQVFSLDPERCVLVGDAVRDIEASHHFGAKAALVLGPKLAHSRDWPQDRTAPEFFAKDLEQALEWILSTVR